MDALGVSLRRGSFCVLFRRACLPAVQWHVTGRHMPGSTGKPPRGVAAYEYSGRRPTLTVINQPKTRTAHCPGTGSPV